VRRERVQGSVASKDEVDPCFGGRSSDDDRERPYVT